MARKSSKKSSLETKEDRSARARASRSKGRRGEHKVAGVLRALWPDVERYIQDRGAAADGPDLSVAAAQLDVEVKHRAESAIRPAIKDARANCRPGNTWAAVDWPTDHKSQPTITCDLHEFVDLLLRERAAAERHGFEAGLAHAAAQAQEQAKQGRRELPSLTTVGPVQSGTLRELGG